MSSSFSLFVQSHPAIFASIFGIIPALVWLWFWLKEDIHPEPTKLIIFTFLGGMLSVFVALPLQHLAQSLTTSTTNQFVLWASIEELLIFSVAWIGGLHQSADDEPVDAIIYMIVATLGFVAMENTLFLIDPLISGNIFDSVITGSLRFIGATLLHVMSSSTIGVFLALSFTKTKKWKEIYALSGVILAITLHTLFNLFIIDGSDSSLFIIFGCVWAGIITIMLAFEKVKSITIEKIK